MVYELILSKGGITILCDRGYEFAKQWKWYETSKGYAARSKRKNEVGKHTILLHRALADHFGILDPNKTIDHKDRNPLNNQLSNLRAATQSEQNRNQNKRNVKHTSEYRGVSWCKRAKRWRASIVVNGKHKHIGYYASEAEAFQAYEEYEKTQEFSLFES